MAKAGKLGKLLKKMQSFGKTTGSSSNNTIIGRSQSSSSAATASHHQLFPVYVGKSRRRYLLTGDVLEHPLFRELVERSPGPGDDDITVSCEVVLFEHLLWMLENADPQPDSLHELVDFYSC